MNRALRDRIVVTGIGVVSPIGSSLDSFWQNASSPTPVAHDGHPEFTGHIDDFGPVCSQTKRVIRKSLKLMNRETQLGVAAAQKAIHASGILQADYQSDRVGVCFGAGNVEIRHDDFQAGIDACRQEVGELDLTTWGRFGIQHVDPLWILRVLPNMPACHTAIANDLRGPNNTITHGSVATNMAVAEACGEILDGDVDAMIVGGTGTGFGVDQQSESGFPPAEAAAAFVLERLDLAACRKANIYAEILSATSATMIEHDHRANPQAAIESAVANALERSNVSESAIEKHTDALKLRVGEAAAGTSALEIAKTLLSMHHIQPSDTRSPVIANVSATDNGLASCTLIGTIHQRVAA